MKMALSFENRITKKVARFFSGERSNGHLRHGDLRRARREAVHRAYQHFARRYPRWAHSLFDEHFVTNTAQDVLIRGLLQPEALADAWTRQFYYRDEARRQRHVRQILPVAEIFVRLVRAEMV